MGFIDYHGTNEDRYSEVIDYAHAQQEEDWKRKQSIKIKNWLQKLNVSSQAGEMHIQELLKNVIIRYKELSSYKNSLVTNSEKNNVVFTEQFWEDFIKELIMRHIEPFHMLSDTREKHFNAFVMKIFKISDKELAKEFYENISEKPDYRRYLTECFDPTWKDQQLFKYIQVTVGKDKSKQEELKGFLKTYRLLGLSMSLYLYQAAQPRDDGWMIQEAAEWNASIELEVRMQRRGLAAPEYRKIRNPLIEIEKTQTVYPEDNAVDTEEEKSFDEQNTHEKIKTFDDVTADIPRSKLRKEEFKRNMEREDIAGYVNACLLLMECELPEDIKSNYDQLIIRMPVLHDSIEKFDSIYHADMDQFTEYFAPEALQLTATYLDYQAVEPSEKIVNEFRDNVLVATRKLLQVVNEKIEEIYKFVTIETKAEAKALEAIISQSGYVDPQFKIK